MKRKLLPFLIGILLAAGVSADTRRVVNCQEWVSLREKPSAKSARLAMVPLMELVMDCVDAEDGFVACTYGGARGYIKAEYLMHETGVMDGTGFASLETLPACKDLKKIGENVLDVTRNDCRVVVQRAPRGEYEQIMAVCYDHNLKPLWSLTQEAPEPSGELVSTSAFIAGTEDAPALVLFVSGRGFSAYGIGKWTDELWSLQTTAVGGGLLTACAPDGTIYAVGYHNDAPICISAAGEMLWAGENDDPECYWPCGMDVDANGLTVHYDTGHMLRYNLDGKLLSKTGGDK